MTKHDIIKKAAGDAGITQKAAETAFNSIFNSISEELTAGEKLNVFGFGSFEAKKCAARTGFNPKTREPVKIPAKTKVVFKASSALNTRLNENGK